MSYTGICTNCMEPCNVIKIDYGIGHYEYWGTPGNDVQIEVVSDCCEAPAVDENNNIVTLQDLKEYYLLDLHNF